MAGAAQSDFSMARVSRIFDTGFHNGAPAPATPFNHPSTSVQGPFTSASGVFERGRRKAPEVDDGQVKDLHARIGELAVADDFPAGKLKPRTGA